jgi:hypothetical protein
LKGFGLDRAPLGTVVNDASILSLHSCIKAVY